jgi:DNA (cytosine-5)-methyltransferase 1
VNHLSLFSGIGGIDLAAHWAGMRTVAFVEQNKFCQQVLAKHWPSVPIFDDVCTLTAEDLHEPIDIISGGFPCQPYSTCGRRMGNEDDRALWPEYARLIKELRPTWVVGENVVGIIELALDNVLADLESLGYTARTFDISATAVGENHERRRIFIVAHSGCVRQQGSRGHNKPINTTQVPYREASGFVNAFQRNALPYVCRDHDGIPAKLAQEELRAYGNAVNPYQVYPIMKAIAEIEAIA